jgi:hypothetical protein
MLAIAPAAATVENKPDAPLLARKHRWFKAWETNKEREQKEAREARQYYHDKQWTDAEIERLKRRGQQPTVRNRIKRKIDFLVGVEQRQRRDPKAFARNPQHENNADTATAGLRYACDVNRWERISSECMHDGLVGGIGVVFIGIEGEGASIDPKMKTVPYDRFFYDPRSVQPDFSDARYMGVHLWMDVDDAVDKWPDHKERLEGMVDANNIQATGALLEQDRATQWGDFENRRVRVVEFWEKRPMAPRMTGFGWHYCFFTGELELEGDWSPYKGEKGEPDNPYEAWSPYIDEKGDRYGLIRTMKSVQDEINYSASKMLHRIASNRVFYEKGTIEDPDELSKQLARPDGKIEIMGGEWGKTVGIIEQSLEIKGEAERFQMAASEIENLGPNPGLVGKGTGVDGASGRALLAQRDSGMTELNPVFELHRDWKLRVHRKLWQRCRQAWQGEKWIRITDDENAIQFVPLNQYEQHPVTGQIIGTNVVSQIDVDIVLDEGPDTITVNEEILEQFSKLGESALGPLGKIIIELSNTPKKAMLLKMIEDGMQAVQPPPMTENPEIMAKVSLMQAQAQKAAAEAAKIMHEVQNPEQAALPPPEPPPSPAEQEAQAWDIANKRLAAHKTDAEIARLKQQTVIDAEKHAHEINKSVHEMTMAERDAEMMKEKAKDADDQSDGREKAAKNDQSALLKTVLEVMTAPKRLVRDSNGRAIGLETAS